MLPSAEDLRWMKRALALAEKAVGWTSPNPAVGAVIVKAGRVLGEGYHHQAGLPHAEIEALRDAARRGYSVRGASLYVTLEPCSTYGRTPPCTSAILESGIRTVWVGSTDPNPKHQGRGLKSLEKAGVRVRLMGPPVSDACERLNEAFRHWIVHRTPFVTLKSAMTLDGKIATANGQSKWITGPESRAYAMRMRQAADAILVGLNTVRCDDPSLTVRAVPGSGIRHPKPHLKRIVLDSQARVPLKAKLIEDAVAAQTIVVVGKDAPESRVRRLEKCVTVWRAPATSRGISIPWLCRRLGKEGVTHLLVEGGGEALASFIERRCVHRVSFFYAPMVLGGRGARKAVAGVGATSLRQALRLEKIEWFRFGADWMLSGRVVGQSS